LKNIQSSYIFSDTDNNVTEQIPLNGLCGNNVSKQFTLSIHPFGGAESENYYYFATERHYFCE